MAGEELGGYHPAGGLFGDRLGAVLAELGKPSSGRILRPGATGAVETVALVHSGQGLGGAHNPHLGQAPAQGDQHCANSGRLTSGIPDRHLVFVVVARVVGHG